MILCLRKSKYIKDTGYRIRCDPYKNIKTCQHKKRKKSKINTQYILLFFVIFTVFLKSSFLFF